MAIVDRTVTAEEAPPPQRGVVLVGGALSLVVAVAIFVTSGREPGLLFVVGLALGVVLFHSRFGFTAAWRQLVVVGQGSGVRAQMLLLAATCCLFAPLLAQQVAFDGRPVTPSLAPIGVALVVGAFLFGLGMQVGGSCASGTLYVVGSGQTALVLTLGGFVAGATLGAGTVSWWGSWPAHDPVSLTSIGGYPGALLVSLTAIVGIAGLTYAVARRGRRPPPVEQPPIAAGPARVLRGAWPPWVGALLLAGLGGLTLWLSGRAWSVTFAFALWGSKLLDLAGVDVSTWDFWSSPSRQAVYSAGVLGERTSVMDLGIILGALVASALAGQWFAHRRVPGRLALGALLGGLLMGVGARLASGCTIGAYLGGVASFSLHGWIWGAVALLGTALGVRLRPWFGLANPRQTDDVC